jgi:hypothetical protein
MHIRAVLTAALAIGLVIGPAAQADSSSANSDPIRAQAAGSDGPPPVLPSLVRTRIARGTKAIERAGDWVDQEDNTKAVVSLRNVRRNMYAAWRGAVDVVENAPPPAPPGDGLRRGGVQARASATYVSPEETAVAVLNFQHDVAVASYGLLDGAKGALRDAVSTTMFAALDRRDRAAVYIHTRPVPPPPPPDLARASAHAHARAHASDEDAPPSFATLMPAIVPDLDDELSQTKALLRGGALTPGEKRIMGQARAQVLETKDQINTWWPPVPAGDD